MASANVFQLDQASPAPAPRRRPGCLRRLLVLAVLTGLVVFALVAVFLANPFEGRVTVDLIELVPPTSPIVVRAHDLRGTLAAVERTAVWQRLGPGGGWRGIVEGLATGARRPERWQAVIAAGEEIERRPADLLLARHALVDVAGEDTVIAAFPAQGEDLEVTMMTRTGYLTRLAFGALELFGARFGLLPKERLGGATLEWVAPRSLAIAGLPGLPRIYLFRERDVILVSTRDDAVIAMRRRLAASADSPAITAVQSYRVVTAPLAEHAARARLSAYVNLKALGGDGFDLEATVSRLLTPDARTLLFESIDFATWDAIGATIPADGGAWEVVVGLDTTRVQRGARLLDLYASEARPPQTPAMLPADVAVSKTASLPFDTFFGLVFENLSPKTRDNINKNVLDQLQAAAADIDPRYGDLIGYLARILGQDFSVFVAPASYAGDEDLISYYPHVGIVFPAAAPDAVRTLIQDVARVLPQVNPDLFDEESSVPSTDPTTGALIFPVQGEFAPLDIAYGITPTFVVSNEAVALLSSTRMVPAMLAALSGQSQSRASQALAALAGRGHGYYYADGRELERLVADAWMNERAIQLGIETVYAAERRQVLVRERITAEGRTSVSSKELAELDDWAREQMASPDEEAALEARVQAHLAPLREAHMARAKLFRDLDHVALAAHYSLDRLHLALEIALAASSE